MPENHQHVSSEELENAYLINNLFTLDAFVVQKNSDIAGQINSLGTVLTAENEAAEQRFEETKSRLSSQLISSDDTLAVKDLILEYKVTSPIDEQFISEMLTIYKSGQEAQAWVNIDMDLLQRVKDSAMYTAVQDLDIRRQIKTYERELETTEVVSLSMGKELIIKVPADTESIQLSVNMDSDPRTEPIRLGPEAVIAVLGGKLTDEDYDAIAECAVNLPGEVGVVCREQFDAAAGFAMSLLQESKMAKLAAVRRLSYANERLEVLLYKDSMSYNPAISIFRRALDRSAMRQFPPYDTAEVPQPFTS